MHDTGKIGIADAILKAPRRLSLSEMEVMRSHAEIGHRILSQCDTPLFNLAAEIALCHHEKWDGTGYPQGLKEEAIPESARIVAIADVFDALTMKRPYKKAWADDDAFDHLKRGSGQHFDPVLVDCFLSIKEEVLETKRYWNQLEAEGKMASVSDLLPQVLFPSA